jgi:ubiquinone/menaquinone biosynthesis C-methylase UbiE
MPVTAGKTEKDISQRKQYAKGGLGRRYWDLRDRAALQYLRGESMLDAGCGEGITLEKIMTTFPQARVEGLDSDPENIAICRTHNLPAVQGSLYNLPYPNEDFDSCLLMEVIEHLDDPQKAIKELARVMRPKGRLVIVFPKDKAMLMARIACLRFREAMFDPGHVRQWNIRDVSKLLSECALTMETARHLPCPFPFSLHGLVVGRKT